MDSKPELRVVSAADELAVDHQSIQAKQETVAEAPSPRASTADGEVASNDTNIHRRRRSLIRPMLFALLPVALVAGGYYYVTGGQIMSTDNAYIQADKVGVTTDVSGIVQTIDVHENEQVKEGQVLFSLDPQPFRIALEGAEAQLAAQRNQILNLKASYKQSLAEIAQAQADLPYFQAQFDRQQNLVNNGSATRTAYDEAKHNLDAANQKVAVAKAEAAAILAQLGGDAGQPVESNPLYLQAKAQVDKGQRDLDHATVKAPFSGIVTNVSSLQVGAYLEASVQGFSLVSSDRLWIDASPKETELTYVQPGQQATVYVDAYPGVVWKGRVESISPASGSSFSLLPAQNTTGNWVKVVQRVPLRVSIDQSPHKPILRVGMSTEVEIDTGHARGLPESLQNLVDRFRGQGHE
jgi:membrane fusion protein (multidrug efflux system)